MTSDMNQHARRVINDMHRQNSDCALQASIELMLTDRPTSEVIEALEAWTNYLKERT